MEFMIFDTIEYIEEVINPSLIIELKIREVKN